MNEEIKDEQIDEIIHQRRYSSVICNYHYIKLIHLFFIYFIYKKLYTNEK